MVLALCIVQFVRLAFCAVGLSCSWQFVWLALCTFGTVCGWCFVSPVLCAANAFLWAGLLVHWRHLIAGYAEVLCGLVQWVALCTWLACALAYAAIIWESVGAVYIYPWHCASNK